MGIIRILPPEVVHRIAAGEVIERPASVLKELVENSLDAHATEVVVDLQDGGKQLIRVRDNGVGIHPDDLPIAFASHATSKLTDEQLEGNLMGVSSLGFRGEALASIGSVAMVTVTSRAPGTEHAWVYRPGEGDPEPAAGEPGTVVDVRNLFYNVPARRKFLRTSATELSHCVQQFTRLALAFPGTGFVLTQGGRDLFRLPPGDGLRDRLRQIVGRDVEQQLRAVQAEPVSPGQPSLTGYVGDPRLHRKDTREQHLFVNGRWVRDRVLGHALRSAYQGYQISGRQPVAYLFLEVDPSEIDVNVHPTKSEVRFRDSSGIYGLVLGAVRDALEGDRSRAAEGAVALRPETSSRERNPPASASPQTDAPDGSRASIIEQAVKEFLATPERRAFPPEKRGGPRRQVPSGPEGDSRATRPAGVPASEAAGPRSEESRPVPRAFQVLECYIVIEAPDGIVIVDQHAFHEKILFEEVHSRLQTGPVESQRLLLPEVIDVPPEVLPLVNRASSLLRPLGFEVEPFGPGSVAVHAFPALFDRETGRTDLPGIVRSALQDLMDSSDTAESLPEAAGEGSLPSRGLAGAPVAVRDALRRLAATVACKRAVKAGMPLAPEEIRALLERGDLAEDPRNCPHGRPTAVFLSRRDIERQFDRK